jgi:O-antigen/teichoic acid export membrane protein
MNGGAGIKAKLTENADQPEAMSSMSGDVSFPGRLIVNVRARISRSRQTIRSVMALLSSSMLSTVLNAIGGLLVARFLGPGETGAFRAFTIPLTYLMFLHLGTFDGLHRQIPYYVGKEMPEEVDRLASAAGAFNRALSIAGSCGFICCAAHSLLHHDFYGVFGWLSQAIFCWEVFYGGYFGSTYRTLNHFVILSKIQVAQTLLSFGMVFLLPFLKFYGLCARVAVPSLLMVWLCQRNRPIKVRYRFDINALRDLIKVGLPFSFWGNLSTSVWVATEGALILHFGGTGALGLFSVGYAIRSAMSSIPIVVYQVLAPRLVTSYARDGSVSNANARNRWISVWLTGFMILLALTGSFLLNYFVPFAIPKYVAGIPIMKICLWFSIIEAANLPLNALFATGRSWLYGRGVIVGIFIFLLATYLLIPALGGALAVVTGSLLGRAARTIVAHVELSLLMRQER